MLKFNLESELIDHSTNKENYNLLFDSYRNNLNILAFVGAGIGRAIGDMLDWSDLLMKMYNEFLPDVMFNKSNVPDLPSGFSELYLRIDSTKQAEFYDKVFQMISSKQVPNTSREVNIAKAFNVVVTTNFDNGIEDAILNVLGKELSKVLVNQFHFQTQDNYEYSLTYLHGSKDCGFCILRKEDYDYFYPSRNRYNGISVVENSLRKILSDWNVVFLGCSIEQDIRNFIKDLHTNTDWSPAGKYFWVVSEESIGLPPDISEKDKSKKIKDFFQSYSMNNIFPIIYKNPIFIGKLCEELAKTIPNVTGYKTTFTNDGALE